MKKISKKTIKSILLSAFTLCLVFTSTFTVYADKVPEHIIKGLEENEPIFVHTPVISPVVILDENGDELKGDSYYGHGSGHGTTQLISENTNVWYELILDNDYIMHWDSAVHREILGYGDSSQYHNDYDKYVQDKWMKFPFEVIYNGRLYELTKDVNGNAGHDYTDWIKIKRPSSWEDTENNHWRDTPIYIPSYAGEMGERGHEGSIFYKVEAINVDGISGNDHSDEQEDEANRWFNLVYADDGANYVATYEIPVQLSGIIYDFTIAGTDNGNLYVGDTHTGSNDLSFVLNKTEKKAGVKNRIGTNIQRYLLDGTLEPNWNPLNTITLTDGKSKQFKGMGAVWRGQTFSFTIKTIANLWDDNGNKDRLEITPKFTYVDNGGNKTNNIKIYYKNSNGSGDYIEYGEERDKISSNWQYAYIGSPQFEGAYYTEDMSDAENGGYAGMEYHYGKWAEFTASVYNKIHNIPDMSSEKMTPENILNRKTRSYCLSEIKLIPSLRLYSGEWEQLKWNIKGNGKEYADVYRYSDLDNDGLSDAAWTGNVDTKWGNSIVKFSKDARFRFSMQTWYGQYYVPESLYVVDLNKHPDFVIEEYMENGIESNDPIFEESGYLIVNFDIISINEGEKHLRYKGNYLGNMWSAEGFDTGDDPSDPADPYIGGDVIVIDLDKSVTDKYSPAIENIN